MIWHSSISSIPPWDQIKKNLFQPQSWSCIIALPQQLVLALKRERERETLKLNFREEEKERYFFLQKIETAQKGAQCDCMYPDR